VVGIGASAGGLDACTKLLETLPAGNGMAFILVQHLDPTHESMMVDLLASRTAMTVRQPAEGRPIEREHLYIIPTEPISPSEPVLCTSRHRRYVTGRVCRSTSYCTRSQRSTRSARSA
jgi:CheB methylesterase